MKSIGETIATLRKEKGMTQSQLAEKMNVTDKAVSKWKEIYLVQILIQYLN